MARSVAEWIGKTDDAPVPPRVRVRVFLREDGRCHKCTRPIRPGEAWTCEHLEALINGGQNRETNLGVTCSNCLPIKNAEDAAIKSKTYRVRARHLGVKRKSGRSFQTNKDGPWRKKLNGQTVPR